MCVLLSGIPVSFFSASSQAHTLNFAHCNTWTTSIQLHRNLRCGITVVLSHMWNYLWLPFSKLWDKSGREGL